MFMITDDILVAGCGETTADVEADHDINMAQLLDRCCTNNIKLNKDMLHWKGSEVAYMSHLITAKA